MIQTKFQNSEPISNLANQMSKIRNKLIHPSGDWLASILHLRNHIR